MTGRNFAALKPLQEARKIGNDNDKNPSSSNAFFRELWQGLWKENEPARREVIEQARVISQLRSGKLIMKRDLAGTGYVFLKPLTSNSGRDRSNYPVFSQNSEILTAKWQKAKIGVRARNFGDGYKAAIVMNDLDTMVKSYFRDIFNDSYETREAYSAQDYGTYITQFEYDDQLNQMIKIAPIIQNQSKVLVDGYGACYDCQFEGHPNDFAKTGAPMPQCPECGGFRTSEMVPDAVADEQVITDIDTVSQGDLTGKLLDWGACQYDPRVFAHESDYFLYSDRVPLRMIRKMFGEGLEIDHSNHYGADDIAFHVMDSLAARGGNTENVGENTLYQSFERFAEEGTRRSMWLKPSMYAGFKLKKAEQTLAGTIPAGVDWADMFPKGLCIRGFNDMRLQTSMYAEKANIASGVYLYQSHSGHGKGISDAVDAAKDMNELYSMAMAGLKRYGAAGVAIDKDAGLSPQDVKNLFKPDKGVFFDTTNNGGDINKSVMQIRVNPVNPALPQAMIQAANMVNLAFMTGDFAQGATNDVSIDTLGGQQLATAKAEAQKGGIFGRKGLHRTMSAEILCELAREHIKVPRWYAHDGDKHSTTRGKWITGADLPKDIRFDVVPDSELPTNKYERDLAKDNLIEKAGGIVQFIQGRQLDPETVAWYAKGRGIDLPGQDEEEVHLVCLERLEQIKELAEMYQDPEQVLGSLTNRLKVGEDAHVAKSKFIQEILDDDDTQEMNPIAIASLELLVDRHLDLQTQFELNAATRQMRAGMQLQAETAAFQQSLMQPQIDAQKAAEEDQAIMGAAAEVGGRILDDEQAQVDHDRERDAKEEDFARQEAAKNNDAVRNAALKEHEVAVTPKPAPAKSQAAKR